MHTAMDADADMNPPPTHIHSLSMYIIRNSDEREQGDVLCLEDYEHNSCHFFCRLKNSFIISELLLFKLISLCYAVRLDVN
jgi:hypothetical protein